MWHVEIRHRNPAEDSLARRAETDLGWLDLDGIGVSGVARLYLMDGPADEAEARRLAEALLVDPVLQDYRLEALADESANLPSKPKRTRQSTTARCLLLNFGFGLRHFLHCRSQLASIEPQEADSKRQ